MADLTTKGSLVQQDIPIKWHDNGDGTWALQTYATAGGATSGATGSSTYGAAAQVTVGVSAVDLVVAGTYRDVIIRALSTNTVSIFWGPTGVTTATGMELKPGEEQIFEGAACPINLLRGIAASANQVVIVMTAT